MLNACTTGVVGCCWSGLVVRLLWREEGMPASSYVVRFSLSHLQRCSARSRIPMFDYSSKQLQRKSLLRTHRHTHIFIISHRSLRKWP